MYHKLTSEYSTVDKTHVYSDNISVTKLLFSSEAAKTLLDIVHTNHTCNSEEDFVDLFVKIQRLFPFEFAFSALVTFGNDGSMISNDIVNISYPKEWMRVYKEREFNKDDVIVKHHFDTFRPQCWSETYKTHIQPVNVLSIAEDFGLKDGYTYGLRTSGQLKRGSLFSFSGNCDKYDKTIVAFLELLIPHLHLTLCRVVDSKLPHANKPLLSGREKEVLNWLKEGKSSWEISVILSISERTVNFHIYNIMQKLEAVNRPHAVAVAASLGLIAFDR
jgi:DNA-binding CsgD family transcriptional regulator